MTSENVQPGHLDLLAGIQAIAGEEKQLAGLLPEGEACSAAPDAASPDLPPPWEEYAERWDPELWLYRERTVSLLRRYFRFSVEAGRVPSLLGRELFQPQVTSYRMATFEDSVIFVYDVERCLAKLKHFEKKLIAKVVLQDYTQDEAAQLIGCRRRTVGRRFPEALDRLSRLFLEAGLLARLPGEKGDRDTTRPESCQEGKNDEISLNDSEQTK
jgi:hypothetical protein